MSFTNFYKHIEMPTPDPSGNFVATLNNTGFMVTHLDPISQEFVNYAAQTKGSVLDIGAAYGIATLEALKMGARVTSNDIEPRHLAILEQRVNKKDKSRLTLSLGDFPDDLNFDENHFDAILISRVLHLFRGETIVRSIERAHFWLKPGGKLFIVAETPYLKIWETFIPVYEERVRLGYEWPGLIEDLSKYISVDKLKNLPECINLLDTHVLTRVITNQNFKIEYLSLIDRPDFPPDRRLDGREGVGLIATK